MSTFVNTTAYSFIPWFLYYPKNIWSWKLERTEEIQIQSKVESEHVLMLEHVLLSCVCMWERKNQHFGVVKICVNLSCIHGSGL